MCQAWEAEKNFMRWRDHMDNKRSHHEKGRAAGLAGEPRRAAPYSDDKGYPDTTYKPWLEYRDAWLEGWDSAAQTELALADSG